MSQNFTVTRRIALLVRSASVYAGVAPQLLDEAPTPHRTRIPIRRWTRHVGTSRPLR